MEFLEGGTLLYADELAFALLTYAKMECHSGKIPRKTSFNISVHSFDMPV